MEKFWLVIVASMSLHGEVLAETMPVLDPSTIEIPDLSTSSNPEVIKDGWKYFLFQREGVSFKDAYADFADCRRFMQPNGWQTATLDRFIPWNSKPGKTLEQPLGPYGMVGALMGEMVEGQLARRDYQSKMRRCMEPRGYVRYGVSAEIWNRIYKLAPDQWVAVQAKIASGPNFGGKVPVK